MKKFLLIFPAALLFAAALSLTACGGNSSPESDQDADQTEMMEGADHDHAAGADHDHAGHDHAGEAGHDHAEGMHGEGPEYNSAYVCPMHCEGSGSDQPGTCPVCGMDYVAQEDHVGNGHTH